MTRDDPAAFAPPPAFGPFRVLHQIGVGALGPVFRTYEPTRDRLVAVKVFRLDITPEQAQALADELSRAADAGLFHPSIVEPVAAGVEGTVAYRAEEYVAAESLDVAIRHYAPASPEKALPFITQLAGAIDFARTAGIGHGALHLRDVFVTPDEARASGFGVVEALERAGLRAPVRRPYSAPERIAGHPWGTPADVFSLGAMAYELLTARRPAGTGADMGPLGAAEAGPHAEAIHAVLARATDDDPERRFPSALAFASALEAAARGEPARIAVGAVGGTPAAHAPAPPALHDALRGELREPARDEAPLPGDDLADDIALEREDDEAYYRAASADELEALRVAAGEEPEALADEDRAEPSLRDEEPSFAIHRDTPPARYADVFGEGGPEPEPDHADQLQATGAMSRLDERESAEDLGIQAAPAFDDRPPYGVASPDDDARGAAAAPADPGYRAPAVEPARTPMLPVAIGIVLGLLVGFAVGYPLGQRAAGPVVETAGSAEAPAGAEGAALAEGGAPGPPGRAETEQAVDPAAGAPDVPGDAPAPGPAERPVATSGTLVVNSTPAKAGVTINGQWRGRTPLTLEKQPFGTYNVRIVQDGFAVATQRVVLSADDPSQTVAVRLERPAALARPAAPRRDPAPSPPRTAPATPAKPTAFLGSMYVDSRPRGARVVLNGKTVGTTPLRIPDLPIGSHVVRLELEDHRVWTTSARVQAGQEARVTGSLDPIR